ncbi:MAG: peptidoglycan DD-metalloendopeptidase family protein [Pseudomonadota bacterium]
MKAQTVAIFLLSWIPAFAGITTSHIAQAQDAVQKPDPAADRLQRQQELDLKGSDLKAEQERVERLGHEIESIRQDRGEISRQLVTTADAVKQTEDKITAGEKRLAEFEATSGKIRESLKRRHDVIAELLAALQRLGRNPPPALLVEPENALKSVRSAILLGAVLPEFTEEAKFLAQELEELVRLKKEMNAEISQQRIEIAALHENRTKLDLLLNMRSKDEVASADELQKSQARAEELAKEVKSLRELIERSEKEIASAQKAAEEAARAEAARLIEPNGIAQEQKNIDTLRAEKDPDKRTLASLANPGRLTPAISFDKAKGLLPMPVSGEKLRSFGEADSYGSMNRGLLLGTRKAAVVTSPADGWVAYSGPFRTYGQIVIINGGSGYHILLAGLSQISVNIGQFVLAGEPIGKMGEKRLSAATAIDVASDQPVLYIEFRKDGATIDPTPWWAANQKAKS